MTQGSELIPILNLSRFDDRQRYEKVIQRLRLDPGAAFRTTAAWSEADEASVRAILADVAANGDAAVVEACRRFDDPAFDLEQIRVKPEEMAAAAARIPADLMAALRRSIAQVREYQAHIMPVAPPPLRRPGVELGLRFTPLDSAGLYFPGGKASYPSSLIMLAVPAQVAGVKNITVCTPPSKYGRSDLVLAACHELGLKDVNRAGGAAAIGAMAFGTSSILPVDKIVGPGNKYVQIAKRLLAGTVGIDGFLGPSEILVIADETARPGFIAADLIAQAEHDPGSCFLLTNSPDLAEGVRREIGRQLASLGRADAIRRALAEDSFIVVKESWDELVNIANVIAAEHVNIQARNEQALLSKLVNAGAVFLGPFSPVAAGDYVAGPSHCLPTNTTARFSSGISVYEFLKRSSVVRYEPQGLANDAPAIVALAEAEGLDAHASSVRTRAAD